jgi:hypothetical protein
MVVLGECQQQNESCSRPRGVVAGAVECCNVSALAPPITPRANNCRRQQTVMTGHGFDLFAHDGLRHQSLQCVP